jgi:hypothetical protein
MPPAPKHTRRWFQSDDSAGYHGGMRYARVLFYIALVAFTWSVRLRLVVVPAKVGLYIVIGLVLALGLWAEGTVIAQFIARRRKRGDPEAIDWTDSLPPAG